MLRFTKKVAVGAAAAGLALGLVAQPVHAVAPNGVIEKLGVAGSDTTQDIMGKVIPKFNLNATANPDPDKGYNIPPRLTGTQTYVLPAGNGCPKITYNATTNPPPNGSSAGITALVNDTLGCIDAARSSRGRSSSDPASLEFYAFAKDAVSWAGFRDTACPGTDTGPVGCAPPNLTQQQLIDIYGCTINNWNQVGGNDALITRYTAQSGSGTRSFFDSKVLGGNTSNNPGCPSIEIQENAGNLVASGDHATAVLPYSFAQWTAQKNLVVPDIRTGAELGKINGVSANNTNISNGTFLGVRYVYNVLKTSSPAYGAAMNMLGVDATSAGYLCSGSSAALIKKYGFVALPSGPSGPGLANSTCRKDPTPL